MIKHFTMTDNIKNPWKGLDSYSYSDTAIFYGRDKESQTLLNIILNNRFTVLYGTSGVGKSSLINAGIRPKLVGGNYFVIDISMRLMDLKSNWPISSQIISQIKSRASKEHIDITPLSKIHDNNIFDNSLWFFFHTNEFWSQKNELLTPIVIIDQFEDIFKDEVRENSPDFFFNRLDELSNVVPPLQLREELKNIESFRYNQSADFRFVFSLREDYLPRLDDYVYSLNIPELRKSRYGISLMDEEQAQEVILRPSNGIVSNNVANEIIDILSSRYFHNRVSCKIEPFLLSLYMYRLYIEMVKRNLSSISEELISKIGADVVNDFYIESMKKISSKAMKHLENVLLTPKGHRDSISIDKLQESGKVADKELDTLLKARIIKKNTVNSVDRIEFTHDVLSKYAQKNKEKREKNNRSKLIVGYLGTFVTLLLSGIVGWIMSANLTYISIPVLIVTSIISSCGIINIKRTSKKRIIQLISACVLLGVCIDLTQIIPMIGYILYFMVYITSFYILTIFSNQVFAKVSKFSRYLTIIYIWVLSFLIVPVMCFGYNIYKGLNYSRGEQFSTNTFYIKDGKGQYGLRDRDSIILSPQYDKSFIPINSNYIAMVNGKYGMIDSQFHTITPIMYDKFIISDSIPHFYVDDKEVVGNGLLISWDKSCSEIQKRIIRKVARNMVPIEGGDFEMGTDVNKLRNIISGFTPADGEEYIHKVNLSNFYLNKYEVTIGEWMEIMEYDPRKRPRPHKSDSIDNLDLPVYKISYETALKFIDKISRLSGLPFSLPTEAQWEYAARGGKSQDKFIFSGSDSEFDVGWVSRNSDHMLHPVGEKKPNSLGLYDMTGNVSEFCKDIYSPTFYKESLGKNDPCCVINENNPKTNPKMVQRGGSFDAVQSASYIVTRRKIVTKNIEYMNSGFRLAINPNSLHIEDI